MDVVDATVERWDDLAEVFGTRGDPSRCWCQFFLGDPDDQASAEANRAALRAQLESGPLGVLAYREGTPAGWCGVAPRSTYPRLARAKVAQASADEPGLWSVRRTLP